MWHLIVPLIVKIHCLVGLAPGPIQLIWSMYFFLPRQSQLSRIWNSVLVFSPSIFYSISIISGKSNRSKEILFCSSTDGGEFFLQCRNLSKMPSSFFSFLRISISKVQTKIEYCFSSLVHSWFVGAEIDKKAFFNHFFNFVFSVQPRDGRKERLDLLKGKKTFFGMKSSRFSRVERFFNFRRQFVVCVVPKNLLLLRNVFASGNYGFF